MSFSDASPPAVDEAAARCLRYRRRILEISRRVPAAHVAPAFSCLEIVDALYHDVMRAQDIFIMSKGHGYLAQVAVLEDLGIIGREEIDRYCRPGGRLGAHPDWAPDLGISASTGSLGHGLGIAAGVALAERLRGSDARVYALLSDGECQEGSTWEAAMVAANLRLDNLIALVDHNDFGGMDRMSEVHPNIEPLAGKFEAFGWKIDSVDGHRSSLVVEAAQPATGRPKAGIYSTVKGRGASFMEDSPIWHYRSPSDEEYELAMRELG